MLQSGQDIYSSRILSAPLERVYTAFADPKELTKWWGPHGFANTFHEFDLRPEGRWALTMHGPEKGHYKNLSIFKSVEPNKLITWTRISEPLFDMEVAFERITADTARISFRMIFPTAADCEKYGGLLNQKTKKILTGWRLC